MNVVSKAGVKAQVIKITAADFNGKDFDGSPFNFGDNATAAQAQFLKDFIKALSANKQFQISAKGCTDYATFDYTDASDKTVNLGPGDAIVITEEGKHFAVTAYAFDLLFEKVPADAL